jgi:predicted RNA binding protein YcfA (HicA-like mRNA interferase family)
MITADCFVAIGGAAMKTSRIRLGNGVLVPSNRIAAVTANAFATLNGVAPGRIDFGVGTVTARTAAAALLATLPGLCAPHISTHAMSCEILRADGWTDVRSRGSHLQLKHPTKPGLVTVPMHGARDIKPGTLAAIERQSGLKLRGS